LFGGYTASTGSSSLFIGDSFNKFRIISRSNNDFLIIHKKKGSLKLPIF